MRRYLSPWAGSFLIHALFGGLLVLVVLPKNRHFLMTLPKKTALYLFKIPARVPSVALGGPVIPAIEQKINAAAELAPIQELSFFSLPETPTITPSFSYAMPGKRSSAPFVKGVAKGGTKGVPHASPEPTKAAVVRAASKPVAEVSASPTQNFVDSKFLLSRYMLRNARLVSDYLHSDLDQKSRSNSQMRLQITAHRSGAILGVKVLASNSSTQMNTLVKQTLSRMPRLAPIPPDLQLTKINLEVPIEFMSGEEAL